MLMESVNIIIKSIQKRIYKSYYVCAMCYYFLKGRLTALCYSIPVCSIAAGGIIASGVQLFRLQIFKYAPAFGNSS